MFFIEFDDYDTQAQWEAIELTSIKSLRLYVDPGTIEIKRSKEYLDLKRGHTEVHK